MSRLCICIRCHNYPEFVKDTIDAVRYYATTDPIILVAIDKSPFQYQMISAVSKLSVNYYASNEKCGWGAGLYKLLCDSYRYISDTQVFDNFLCIDYDTLPTRKGFDEFLLSSVSKDPEIVLAGSVQYPFASHVNTISRHWSEITSHITLPGYDGSNVLGAMMLLTESGISRFNESGYFDEPYRSVLGLKISDDHWMTMLALSVGRVENIASYSPSNVSKCNWTSVAITWSNPVPKEDVVRLGCYMYHPCKGRKNRSHRYNPTVENSIREYFRSFRK